MFLQPWIRIFLAFFGEYILWGSIRTAFTSHYSVLCCFYLLHSMHGITSSSASLVFSIKKAKLSPQYLQYVSHYSEEITSAEKMSSILTLLHLPKHSSSFSDYWCSFSTTLMCLYYIRAPLIKREEIFVHLSSKKHSEYFTIALFHALYCGECIF